MRKTATLVCLLLPILTLKAQDPKVKFGKIKPEELQAKLYSIDSSANTVVLSDVGRTEIVGNT
jgi:hypothetical protein